MWPAPCRSIGLDWFTKMWARSASLGSLLLKLLPSTLAEHLEELLTSITEALKEKADNLPSKVKDGITIVKRIRDKISYLKRLIDASRLAFEKPVYFLNVCPAIVLRGAELSENTDETTFKELKDTFGAGNILEYDYPLYNAFKFGRYAGLGCSLVRAMKIPSNVASISHDSSVGAEPHNYFSLAFNGATFEQRTPALFGSGRFVAQQIYVMRFPILQTVWGEKGLGLVSKDEIRIQVCARARVVFRHKSYAGFSSLLPRRYWASTFCARTRSGRSTRSPTQTAARKRTSSAQQDILVPYQVQKSTMRL